MLDISYVAKKWIKKKRAREKIGHQIIDSKNFLAL